ncbi:MAG TPA: hypothetical protein VHP83_16985 [Aggregatilineaceae bacterium]|nr:hypothetical protein [Aggregatilineaceae bacterium]
MAVNTLRFFRGISFLIVLVAWIFVPSAQAHTTALGVFYAASINPTTHVTSIWEINTTTTRRILTVSYLNPATPADLFPEHEHEALLSAIEQGSFLATTAGTPGVTQAIQGVWQLDSDQLLVQTNTETCDRVAGGCYGYFEFLLADIATGSLTSLHQIEYHNDGAEKSWAGCPSTVHIDTVLPNPEFSKFAFTLKPTGDCYPNPDQSQAYVVDFATLPVQITEIPLANGLSWSPSGTNLAYYVKDACQSSTCVTSLYVQSSAPQLIEQAPLFNATPLFTAWVDDQTVMYQWHFSESSEEPYFLIWHDLNNHTKVEVPLPYYFLSNGMFYLKTHLLGLSYPGGKLLGLPTQPEFTVLAEFPASYPIFYNSRFNSYLFTHLQGSEVTVIDAEFDQFTLNLADFIPSETVIYVAPGR